MNKLMTLARIVGAGVLSLGLGLSATAAERISDFSLIAHNGKFYQLSRETQNEALVLVAHADTRDVRRAVSDLDELIARFADRNVGFFMINSSGETDKDLIARMAADDDINVPVLMDDTQLVAQELGIQRALDVVIIDPEAKEVVYRGALNDRWEEDSRARRASEHYAAEALTQFLAGDEVSVPQLASRGDAIDFSRRESAGQDISYAGDIAPILQERCVSCHQEGGIAPFAMTNHQMVRGWSPMIREVLYTKRMPPGQIDPDYVQDFYDVAHITPEETQMLVSWIDNGAQNESASDPLAGFEPTSVKWNYGEPDMIIDVPAQQIPATGVQDYRNLQVPLNLDRDVWVKAVEFEPGDTTVLHHIIAFAYGPNGLNEFEVLNQGIGLGAYAPGNEINTYPEGAGFPLKAGGGLMLQMHYTTSGKETVDQSQIALYLWDEEPERPVLGGSAADLDIAIAPFERRHEMNASAKFRKDSYLSMLGPHMHYRGYDANFVLRYPDGREEEILNVPNYQFNWQKVYDFKEPLFVPAGSELLFSGTFDNSETNPFNPDPSQTLSWGEQTWQEMFFGFYRYVEAGDGE
ncbi:MAG: redoxin domain-containing protein [Pseudohongiellaceae bacterium]